jgi:transposase
MFQVEIYGRVRRAVLVDGRSLRAVAREFGISRKTIEKMLRYSVPPGYQRQLPMRRPKLGPWLGVIDAILKDDKTRPAKALRLPTILREYDKVARQCAEEKADFPRYLLRLTELELVDRDRRATERRIRQAKFPVVKTLDTFDFLAIPSANKTLVLDLARCEFLSRKEKSDSVR